MLYHVVLFTWKEDVTEAETQALKEGLAGLPGQIPEIRSYRFGPDAGLRADNADLGLVAEFDDAEAFRRYVDHPAHKDLVVSLVRPLLGSRRSVQFTA